MRRINVMLLALLFLSCLSTVVHGQIIFQGDALHISLSKSEFVLTESIVMSISASNPTDEQIFTYNPRSLSLERNFVVTFEDGTRLEYVGPLDMRGSVYCAPVRLIPDESRTVEHDLCQYFKIDKAGTYTVQATWGSGFVKAKKDGEIVSEETQDGEPFGPPMKFRVLPLNIVYQKKETRHVWTLGKRHKGPGIRETLYVFIHETPEGNLKFFARIPINFCKYVGDVARGTTPEGLQDDDGHVHVLFQKPDGVYQYKKLHKYTGKALTQEEIRAPSRLQRTANGDVELIR